MNFSADVVCVIDCQGIIQRMSAAGQAVFGLESAELVGRPFAELIDPAGRPAAECLLRAARLQAEPVGFACRCLGPTGQVQDLTWTAFQSSAGELMCVGRARAAAPLSPAAEAPQEMHGVLIGHGFDMVCLLTEEGCYAYVGGSTSRILGYLPEQYLGQSVFKLIHPADLATVQAQWDRLGAGPSFTFSPFRFRAANGDWKWLESTVSNQIQNPAIQAYAVSSRDITTQQLKCLKLEESEQRMRLLFEHSSALAVFQTPDGLIRDANPGFLLFFQKTMDEVRHQPLVDFLPLELRPMFEQNLRGALGGQRAKAEATVASEAGEIYTIGIKHVPLEVGGQIIGVHVMVKDITEMQRANRLIQRQAEELTTTLESITDAFFSLDKDWNLTYLNREAERLSGMSRADILGRNLWEVFPRLVGTVYQRNYQQAVESGETVHFEAFNSAFNIWLEVKAFPSVDGLSVYFSDITNRLAAGQELKRLALVAQGTDNAVVITDAAGRTEWVNDAFTKHTGYTLADMLGYAPDSVLRGPETEPATLQCIRDRMLQRKPFSVVMLNYKKNGQKLWLSMDISPIFDEAGELTQFITIQQNINYRKEAEASQAKLTQDLHRQNLDLQQFTYIISHNLRAPLANALGLSKLLTKVDKQSLAFDTSLAYLRQSVEEVDQVLKDFNIMLSIRDKQDVLEPEPVVLAVVCQQVVLNLDKALRKRGGQVRLDIAEGLQVCGNRAYLYSIFYNLLLNSIKYSSEERALLVGIKCNTGTHGGLTISFSDNGSGFDMCKAGSDVFQLYKRFHTNQRGRGIGLYLVKAHVEAMGGKIEVASGVNFGTRFLIHLDKR